MGFLSGLASIANSIVSPIANKRSSEREYKRNRSLMQEQYQLQAQENQLQREWQSAENEKAYQQNIEQWNRENEYNTPAAQMQRYVDAGLNPTLAIGGSSVAASSPQFQAVQSDVTQVPNYTPYHEQSVMGDALGNLASGLGELENYDTDKSLKENLLEQSSLSNRRQELENERLSLSNDEKRAEQPYFERSAAYRVETMHEQLNKLRVDTSNASRQGVKLELEADRLRQDLKLKDGEYKRLAEIHDMDMKARALSYRQQVLDLAYNEQLQQYRLELLPKIKSDAEYQKAMDDYQLKIMATREQVEKKLDKYSFFGMPLGDISRMVQGWIQLVTGFKRTSDPGKKVIKNNK